MKNNSDNKIHELSVYDEKNQTGIFTNSDKKYIIPLYQRAFAWEDLQIQQLVDDIYDNDNYLNYYLGSLIVAKTKDGFSVIDGQQRLTTLFLLFIYLKLPFNNVLTFECRPKSDFTLAHLSDCNIDYDDMDEGLLNGFKIIKKIFSTQKIDVNDFIKKLAKVKIYRIEVPDNTDLNHYFEIINTRGEQLEQTDILKATLLNKIDSYRQKEVLSKIWDACSDMNGYVQMHFEPHFREALFGYEWTGAPNCNARVDIAYKKKEIISIKSIINDLSPNEEVDTNVSDVNTIRFESIINFSYFLLHVLKIYIKKYKVASKSGQPIINELLDDKKLFETFDNVISNGFIQGQRIVPQNFSIQFIHCLLDVRFLFDKYIIKREYSIGNADEGWSLKSLESSLSRTTRKPYYANTSFKNKNERRQTWERRHKHILMMQACLRVSYTSPKIMHWITHILSKLYLRNSNKYLHNFEYELEKFIANQVYEDYLKYENYSMGVNTPHIVFNYLDYLLWKNDEKLYKDFSFEFRNSVEHWYPQHPSKGSIDTWTDDKGLNFLGNLCIIQRNVNSKFSNMSPLAKKDTYKKMVKNGSIKLRIMAQNTTESDKNWREKISIKHGNEMIAILEDAVNCIRNE